MDLLPDRIGLIGGLFYGLNFGLGGIAAGLFSAAINKIDIAFYVSGSCLPTWDALQRYVRYEPIRVVRVGWSS